MRWRFWLLFATTHERHSQTEELVLKVPRSTWMAQNGAKVVEIMLYTVPTFVRVQYKVQGRCRTKYRNRTCMDLENPEEEELKFVVEQVGLLELASGDASLACEIVSRLGKQLTI